MFNRGKVYKRSDLHDKYGGQRQGGISTPAKNPYIFLFSGESGESYGYQDGWTESEEFLYTGEGQVGDMEFIRGNAAIRDHELNGNKLFLFISAHQAHVTYEGQMRCIDYEYFKTLDRDDNTRRAIRFILERINDDVMISVKSSGRKTNYKKPNKTERKGLITSRVGQGYYRQQILEKFNYKCAVTKSILAEVLIASHILPWRQSTEDERLDVENGILLSPNYDALFDKHLISFEDNGKIIISNLLAEDDLSQLGIDKIAKISLSFGMKNYLAKHREGLR